VKPYFGGRVTYYQVTLPALKHVDVRSAYPKSLTTERVTHMPKMTPERAVRTIVKELTKTSRGYRAEAKRYAQGGNYEGAAVLKARAMECEDNAVYVWRRFRELMGLL
jgi:hypothetical protein